MGGGGSAYLVSQKFDFILKENCWFQVHFFGLPSVIEHLNYDQWSGHDTLNDQKIHWKAIFIQVHVACKENFLVTCVMSRPWVIIKVLNDT